MIQGFQTTFWWPLRRPERRGDTKSKLSPINAPPCAQLGAGGPTGLTIPLPPPVRSFRPHDASEEEGSSPLYHPLVMMSTGPSPLLLRQWLRFVTMMECLLVWNLWLVLALVLAWN